jgi:hypothetical protein
MTIIILYSILTFIKNRKENQGWVQGLIPMIPTTWEAVIGTVMDWCQPRQKFTKTPSQPISWT